MDQLKNYGGIFFNGLWEGTSIKDDQLTDIGECWNNFDKNTLYHLEHFEYCLYIYLCILLYSSRFGQYILLDIKNIPLDQWTPCLKGFNLS